MIFVDANILLYAENGLSPQNADARRWWDAQLAGDEPVALPWPVLTAFLRVSTNPRAFKQPLTVAQASRHVEGWLNQPCVGAPAPTSRHWEIYRELLEASQARANLVMDAHLAALTIEYGGVLCSADADFARFPRLKWRNPLA